MFDLIGKTVGPYRILEQIGVGGMAVVYKAYHATMDRTVAIKVLPPHLSSDPEFLKRFQREARAIARLEHAHILPVYDYGEYEGITYLVMRFVEAGTLKNHMAAGTLSLEEINSLIGQIGSALDYAHRLGIVHRDVKPGNVLIDERGDTYLTDFGLARMMEPSQRMTASGVGLGTPAYMSPEQGQGIKVDHRSDIYSLGVILYEMLTGRVPYEAETPMAVVLKHITGELPLPHSINPNVPEPVEHVVLKAVAKEPGDRYQTAGEMVQALAIAIRKSNAEAAGQPVNPPAKPRPCRDREDASLIARIQQAWAQPRGKIMLAGGMMAILAITGLLLSRIPGRIDIVEPGTGLPASTQVLQQAQIASPAAELSIATTEPTTEAPVPQTEHIRAFAGPILASIADREPTYEDDFSNQESGWETRVESEACCYGTVGYQNGEYVVIADPLKPAQMQENEGWNWARGNNEQIAPGFTDYVLEIDQAWLNGSGLTSLYLCDSHGECYSFRLGSPDISLDLWMESLFSTNPRTELVNGLPIPWISSLDQPTSLMVIKKGLEVAVYTGGMPVHYIRLPEEFQRRLDFIQLRVGTNSMDQSSEVHWDNLRIWDLSDLPLTASSGPDLSWEQVYDNSIFQRADVSAIAVDPKNPKVMYAATSGGLSLGTGAGIYKSMDGGETWMALNDGLDHTSVSEVFIDPVETGTVYVTTFGAGPYKSTDGGAHWKPINTGLTNLTGKDNGVSSLAFDPADHLRLYHADPYEGLFRSTDGGETWQFVVQPCQSFMSLVVDPRDGNHLFAGAWPNTTCPGGLFESTDGGLNWTPIAQDIMDIEKAVVWGIVIDPRTPDSLYASVEYTGLDRPSEVIASTNGGKDWNVLRNAGWGVAIAINPNDSRNMYLAEGIELYRTEDGGRTWETLRGGFAGSIEALAFSGETLYVGATGVYWTRNGGQSWETGKSGFGSTWVELSFDPAGKVLYTEDNDCALYRSQDGAATWENLRSSGCGLAFDRESDLIYRIGTHSLHRSADGGRTWSDTGLSPIVSGGPYRIYTHPTDADTLYTLYSCCPPGPFIYRSTNTGQAWQPLPTVSDLYHGSMVIAEDGLRIYAASYSAVDVSHDGGESWSETQTTTNNNGNPPALALHPQDSSIALLGTWGAGILKTTNAGETWSTANAGLANLHVNSLAYDQANPDVVFAGTDGGVLLSQNGGDSWTVVNDGLGSNLIVYSIAVDPKDSSRVFAVTPDGMYRLE